VALNTKSVALTSRIKIHYLVSNKTYLAIGWHILDTVC